MKRWRAALVCVLLPLVAALLTGCQRDPGEPKDLRGQWGEKSSYQKLVDGDTDELPDYCHVARVSDETIEIYYYYFPDGSKNLYWYGTFTPPEDGREPYEWTSTNLLPKNLSPKLYRYASRDAEKQFTYQKEQIEYIIAPSQALRMTVTLVRDETDAFAIQGAAPDVS